MLEFMGHAVAETPTGVARALLLHSQGLSLIPSSSILLYLSSQSTGKTCFASFFSPSIRKCNEQDKRTVTKVFTAVGRIELFGKYSMKAVNS